MDLQKTAQAEAERRTRSKLEPHREAIFTLRRKHWTYGQIARWLNEHGVSVTLSSVHRYCQRAISRRLRAGAQLQPLENIPFSISQTATQTNSEPKKYRFNVEDV
jgi:hypothetical protein